VRAAVTGGAGFVGSAIVDALLEEGHSVTVIDDLSTGRREYVSPVATFHNVDIADSVETLASVLRDHEVLFHEAALARVGRSIADPLGTHRVNVTGTLHVLKAAVDAGIRRVVYASSSSVYGDQPTLPLTEDMTPNPMNPYAVQKLMGELYCRVFSKTHRLETVCLRYFNVYGPRQAREGAYRLVLSVFLEQRARGEPLTIDGDGEQTRDFTHVTDVARANVLTATAPGLGFGEAINIGSGDEISINRLASFFEGEAVHRAPRGNDERFKRASITRAGALLGWKPTVQIEEGVRALIREAD
jgi:UDP-glucose 4-epimerase